MKPEDINKLLASKRDQKFRKRTDSQLSQGAQLRGVKRKDQSARMSGDNNPMSGKVSPNRGKAMPQISKKIKGKAKPEGFGEKISKARKGVPNLKALGVARPDHSETMKDPARNKGAEYMREVMTCPYCGKTANGPNYKRWHGDNCKMKNKNEKSKTSKKVK